MLDFLPREIQEQVAEACRAFERRLGPILKAIHLYGSAVDGGLKPASDLDLLVTTSQPPSESRRRALVKDLLRISVPNAPMGTGKIRRPLEVTVLAYDQVTPWRYPPRRELQYGEWLRNDFLAGMIEPPVEDPDLAILLAKARRRSVALLGPPAEELFQPVPRQDFLKAMADTVIRWNKAEDWSDDEANVVLTLARMWYSIETGDIAPKDVAAAWLIQRVPAEHSPVLAQAREAYLRGRQENLPAGAERVAAFIYDAKAAIERLLENRRG